MEGRNRRGGAGSGNSLFLLLLCGLCLTAASGTLDTKKPWPASAWILLVASAVVDLAQTLMIWSNTATLPRKLTAQGISLCLLTSGTLVALSVDRTRLPLSLVLWFGTGLGLFLLRNPKWVRNAITGIQQESQEEFHQVLDAAQRGYPSELAIMLGGTASRASTATGWAVAVLALMAGLALL